MTKMIRKRECCSSRGRSGSDMIVAAFWGYREENGDKRHEDVKREPKVGESGEANINT